jgi:hypothetical protein
MVTVSTVTVITTVMVLPVIEMAIMKRKGAGEREGEEDTEGR